MAAETTSVAQVLSPFAALPWKTDAMSQYVWATDKSGDYMVAQIRGWGHLTGVGGLRMDEDLAAGAQAQNMAYIVTACNAFPDLLAALKGCEAVLGQSAGDAYNVTRDLTYAELGRLWIAVTEQARAAIAKAEGR